MTGALRFPKVTRRDALVLGGAAVGASLVPGFGRASTPAHGMSVFGQLKYPEGFANFDYVNPDAPKGGRIVTTAPNWYFNQSPLTFNTLNGHVDRGDAAPRIELIYDTLMAAAVDETDSSYGLLARSVSVSDDRNTFTFTLRPEARWHDGSPVTAADVVFALEILKSTGNASIRLRLREMAGVEAPDPQTVVVRFSGNQSLLLPNFVVQLPIFPKAYWATRDFGASTLEEPLGSGPYRVGRADPGRFIEYHRVDDYWGRDLGVVRGAFNFDVIRLEFFRERIAAFEAFKKGALNWREEFTSKEWATGYDFPAVQDGRVVKTQIPAEKRPALQAWFLNSRRSKLADPRTREAIGLAFDFEWTNENLFFNTYKRSNSYFEKSVYAAHGSPDAEELALLEPHRDRLAPAVFGDVAMSPVSDGSGRDRKLLRKANRLLRQAGWSIADGKLVDGSGEQLTIEFLINAPVFERILGKYVDNLESLGIKADIRLVDAAQYQRRLLDFDYDVIGRAFSLTPLPIEDVPTFFHSRTVNEDGSSNYSGVNDPVVDALLDSIGQSKSHAELQVRMRVLDRVLRAGFYVVPNWTSPHHRVAHWDVFGIPQMKPDYLFPFETTWWYDADKAAKIGQ